MKVFKRIYYPVLALLLVLMTTLGFVNASTKNGRNGLEDSFISNVKTHIGEIAKESHNSNHIASHERVRDYITGQLAASGLVRAAESTDADGEDIFEFPDAPVGTYMVQQDVLSQDTMREISFIKNKADDGENFVEVEKEINNIVVYLPGTKTKSSTAETAVWGDVVMMMAHYDSRAEGPGASDNSVAVASMLENIKFFASGSRTFENDLLFVFTDAEEEGMYGAYAFKHQFNGFGDIYSRVKLGTNFDALGNKGTMVMFQSSDKNYQLISAYSKINGSAFTSSIADFVYGGMSNYTDFDIFRDKTSLNFATLGGREVYHTAKDTVENVHDSIVIQHANKMHEVVKRFGSYDLDKLSGNSNAVYFSYLDLFTIVYPYVVSFVFGALIIGLLAAIVYLNIKKKQFSFSKAGMGLVVQLLSILATAIVLFVLYYLISLLMSGLGVIPIRAIGKIIYSNVGLMIGVMLLTVVLSSAFIMLLKKIFMVKAADVVRGNAILWAVLGAVLAFAAPNLSYFFAITALLEMVVMLLVTLFGQKFKDKHGIALGRFFPYALPLIITLPMIIPVIMIASMVLNMMFIPVIMVLFMLLSGFLTPYFGLTKPVMDKLYAKLPKRTIRVESVVTEQVEDIAKKGKFVEKTYKKITKEKIARKYHSAFGLSVLGIVFTVMIIFFSAFGFHFGTNFIGMNGYRDAVYNGSVVYVWEKTDNIMTSTKLQVRDLTAYKYIREALDLEWNADAKAYEKVTGELSGVSAPSIVTDGTGTDKSYSFTAASSGKGQIQVKLLHAEVITSVTVEIIGRDEFKYENEDALETIVLNLPYGISSFTMKLEGTTEPVTFEYSEHVMDVAGSMSSLANVDDWNMLLDYLSDHHKDASQYIRSGMAFYYNGTL